MTHQKKPVLFILLFAGFILLIFLIMQPLEIRYGGEKIAMLFPKGWIALKERNLLFIVQGLMLLVVIPVYILTFVFSWKYRAHNPKAKYTPEWDDNKVAEVIWWGIPLVLVIIISALTWIDTHKLDPYKPLVSDKEPVKIQVVALQWKWLFIYPEENVATVNYLQIPEKTPINFEITADAPMNSFWIPALGGQIYAMPKMKTKLHLMADEPGEYFGASANISGAGFSGMKFVTKATTEEDYKKWLSESKQATSTLNLEEYNKLAQPSSNNAPATYQLKEKNLFETILMKYMHPQKVKE